MARGFVLRLPFENARLRAIRVDGNNLRIEFDQHTEPIVLPMRATHLDHE
jgi:hypothetical protein